MTRVEYDPQADAAMVYLIEGALVDHWDADDDGLVVGRTHDGRVAQCELWSIKAVGFVHYKRLPLDVKDQLHRLAETDPLPLLPPLAQG
jgi:uncharacterized protein YuzE